MEPSGCFRVRLGLGLELTLKLTLITNSNTNTNPSTNPNTSPNPNVALKLTTRFQSFLGNLIFVITWSHFSFSHFCASTCYFIFGFFSQKPGSSAEEPLRFPQSHAMFERLTEIIVTGRLHEVMEICVQ